VFEKKRRRGKRKGWVVVSEKMKERKRRRGWVCG
jgi:hypothetical protein